LFHRYCSPLLCVLEPMVPELLLLVPGPVIRLGPVPWTAVLTPT
jgi:hypothetical protein